MLALAGPIAYRLLCRVVARQTHQHKRQMSREKHFAALASLHPDPGADGAAIYRRLRRIERIAHDAATANCDGAAYNGQPFRPDWDADGEETDFTPWQVFKAEITAKVAAVFGGRLPAGFFFNQDARGCALKIRREHVPAGLDTDWGGDGVLSPDF